MGIRDALVAGVSGFSDALTKGYHGDIDTAVDPPPSEEGPTFAPPGGLDWVGLFEDPQAWYSNAAPYQHKPARVGWGTLQRVGDSAIIAPIVRRLVDECAEFATPQENPYLPGFAIRMRDRRKSPSRAALRHIEETEAFMSQCGVLEDSRQGLVRDDLTTFMKKLVRDSLYWDWAAFQVIPNHHGRPAAFCSMPSATIRVAQQPGRYGERLPETDYTTPRYVQIYDEQVVAEFPPTRLAVGVRNPRSDINSFGYGFAEGEMLITKLTAWLGAFTYNAKQFSQGVSVKGILNLAGAPMASKAWRSFKRELKAMIMGSHNAHRLPVASAEKMEFVNLMNNNRDMEFHQWLDFLIKLICACYGVDPAQINFIYGNTGQSSAMGSASAAERITLSRDRALRPLIRHALSWLNRWIVWRLDPDFTMVPMGLGGRSEEQALQLDKLRLDTSFMVDEVRAMRDDPPLPDGKGAVILNQTWLQHAQGEQGGEPGAPGEAGAPGAPAEADPSKLFGEPEDEDHGEQEAGTEAVDEGEALQRSVWSGRAIDVRLPDLAPPRGGRLYHTNVRI